MQINVEDIATHFPAGVPSNVGILLGKPSGNLVDIDLDCLLAVRLARFCLPPTDCKFGRVGKPQSHWLYTATATTKKFADPVSGEMLVEIRADSHHTVFPPSIHPSGEAVVFDGDPEDPSPVDADELLRQVGYLAAATLLVRHWPDTPGSRRNGPWRWSGCFCAEGGTKSVARLVTIVAAFANDKEIVGRAKAGEYGKKRLEEGKSVYGWPKFSELFGSNVAEPRIREWLQLSPREAHPAGATTRSFAELQADANSLSGDTSPEDIHRQLVEISRAKLRPGSEGRLLQAISKATSTPMLDLRREYKGIGTGAERREDLPTRVAMKALESHYQGGPYLVRADNVFWRYKGRHWAPVGENQISKHLIAVAREIVEPGEGNVVTVADLALRQLRGMRAAEGDPLRLAHEPAPIINVQNGELWLDENGEAELRPHSHSSYLTHCLEVDYNPEATCPRYDDALLGIFAKSVDPHDMARHFNEFFGYAIQPVHDIPTYFIMRGMGANGKTSLLATVARLMGPTAVLAEKSATLSETSSQSHGSRAASCCLTTMSLRGLSCLTAC